MTRTDAAAGRILVSISIRDKVVPEAVFVQQQDHDEFVAVCGNE